MSGCIHLPISWKTHRRPVVQLTGLKPIGRADSRIQSMALSANDNRQRGAEESARLNVQIGSDSVFGFPRQARHHPYPIRPDPLFCLGNSRVWAIVNAKGWTRIILSAVPGSSPFFVRERAVLAIDCDDAFHTVTVGKHSDCFLDARRRPIPAHGSASPSVDGLLSPLRRQL